MPIRDFYQSLVQGRAVHAYIISGPKGSGKRAFADKAVRALLCENPKPSGDACGTCGACVRIGAGSHPDVIVIRPAKASIGVDEVRELIGKLAVAPFEGGRRAIVIEDAGKLTAQAQNALLKALEEPTGDACFFLLTSEDMLPTILSRCRMIRMLPDENVAAALEERGIAPNRAAELAALSGGAFERALELNASPTLDAAREKALAILRLKSPADVPALWQSLSADKDIAREILLWIECAASDALRARYGAQPLMPDLRFTFAKMRGIIEEIIQIRRKLGSNVSWNVAVEPLLFLIAEGETE